MIILKRESKFSRAALVKQFSGNVIDERMTHDYPQRKAALVIYFL
jgi:hypothetical protein